MNMIYKYSAQCLLASCLILSAGCSDNLLEVPESIETSAQRLVLTANTSSPTTRMELGQDGLTTQWEPGDQLVLYKKDGGTAPIYLNTNIQTASSSATFESDGGVPAGDYWVFYNYNDNRVFYTYDLASVDQINNDKRLSMYGEITVTQGMAQTSVTMNHMYAQVTIELNNLPALNSYKDYTVGMYSPKRGFSTHQMFTSTGMENAENGYDPNSLNPWQSTWFVSNVRHHNFRLGRYQITGQWDPVNGSFVPDDSEAKGMSALIFPVDLSQEEVFFYVLDDSDWENLKCYECKKAVNKVNFKAGVRYKVVLDMNNCVETTLIRNTSASSMGDCYTISSVEEWRHAAYRGDKGWVLNADLDFQNKDFFPLGGMNFNGENHTISNITLDRSLEDNVSPFEYMMSISDLTIDGITIKGNNRVGGLANDGSSISNCKIIGTSSITGTGDYVGGIAGRLYFQSRENINNVSIGQNVTVSGRNYVGGIVGALVEDPQHGVILSNLSSSVKPMEKSISNGTVTATGDYVGGVFGKIGGNRFGNQEYSSISFNTEGLNFSIVKCINYGTVKGNNYVGGVGGALHVSAYCQTGTATDDLAALKFSLNQGAIEGNERVGGILGSSMCSVNTCYSIESVKGATSVGGILGDASLLAVGGMGNRVANCYSLATVTATGTTNPVAGGIVGLGGGGAMGSTVVNSYFAGTCSTNYGIIGKSEGSCIVTSCLSTTSSLGDLGSHMIQVGTDALGNPTYQQFNDIVSSDSQASVTSILDNINVINGDGAYCTNVWSGYNYEPVKFTSFSADTDAPDFTTDTIL